MPVEEDPAGWCQSVLIACFREKAVHNKIVAQNAHASFGCICCGRQGCRIAAVTDQSKKIEFYGGYDGGRLSARKHRIDH
ncbi:hypothetical protein RsS62_18780 [Rhizobium dioscoreae]|nr:hypothetical protein RsS62_18780 [Rhizobium dioscoreae]